MGSGLDSQLGFAAETTVGTETTVDHFVEFLDEDLTWEPTWLDSAGLKAGQRYKRESRVVQSRRTVTGGFNAEFADQGMGLLIAHMLGSAATPVQIAATTAYSQIHTPGDKTGLGLTVQVGRPEVDSGIVRPHTYRGCKIPTWEFTSSDGEIAKLRLDVDGWDEATATALAAASYAASAGVFNFSEAATFNIGGTPATASGETTITGGTAIGTIINAITIRGETPMATERFGHGNAGIKAEQVENDIPMVTATLEGEYFDRTEFYDLFKANTTTALQLDFSHGDAGGGNAFLLSWILPAAKIKTGGPQVGGPDIVGQTLELEAYDNGADPPIQIKLISTDAVL
jgi:hypothetical protein